MSPRKNVTYSSRPTHAARSAHAKGEKLFRTYDTSYIRPRRNMVPAIISIIILIAVIVALVIFGVGAIKGCSHKMVPEGQEVSIIVKEGDGAIVVGRALYDAGLIDNQNEFVDKVSQSGVDAGLHPGEYVFVGGQSVDEIINKLQVPLVGESVVIPEGLTIKKTAERVADASKGRIKVEEFTDLASNASRYADSYSFLKDAGDKSLEGYLFPKSYSIADTDSADSIIRMMLDQYDKETSNLDWARGEAHGYSRYDLLKLASLVEKEADASHRADIASVFFNRLRDKMKLQSDATVAYYIDREPTAQDIETYNDYNTYSIEGLPPTPICSPSRDAIRAVLEAPETKYFYFYHERGEDGKVTTHLSETYVEHRATYE